MANLKTIQTGLQEINDAYPERMKIVSATVNIWKRAFEHMPNEVFLAGVQQAINECQFPPTVADVFSAVKGMMRLQMPSGLEAWSQVKSALSLRSGYSYIKSYEALAGSVADKIVDLMGGLDLIASSNEEFISKQFISLYDKQMNLMLDRSMQPPTNKKLISSYASELCTGIKQIEGADAE